MGERKPQSGVSFNCPWTLPGTLLYTPAGILPIHGLITDTEVRGEESFAQCAQFSFHLRLEPSAGSWFPRLGSSLDNGSSLLLGLQNHFSFWSKDIFQAFDRLGVVGVGGDSSVE